MIRRVRIFGFEVLSIETYDEPEEPLTAGDNGGTTYSERTEVGFVQGFERTDGWEDRGA